MQLPLNIRLVDAYCFANFFGDQNDELVTALRTGIAAINSQASSRVESIFVSGLPGSGKTHLLQSACQMARELEIDTVYLPLGEPGLEHPGILEDLSGLSLVCIDNIQTIAGQASWETAIFSLYENLKDHGLLICASTVSPADTGFGLKDLVSRFNRGLVYVVRALDHEQKLEVLRRRAHLRGLEIGDEVIAYIEKNFPRDMQTLVTLLDQLDQESLVQQRKITIPFVRSLVGEPGGQ